MSGASRARSAVAVALALAVVALGAGVARAEDRDLAQRHFDAAKLKSRAGDHRGAIADFEAALRAAPRPKTLYNLGREHAFLADAGSRDEARRACDYFRGYLAALPNTPDRGEVEQLIARLEAPPTDGAPAVTVAAPAPAAVTVPPPSAPIATTTEAARAPERRQRGWLWVALGVAAAVVVAGAAVALGVALTSGPRPPMGTRFGVFDVSF